MNTPKKIFKKIFKIHRLSLSHYVILSIILFIGVFNIVTGIAPNIRQFNREQNIEKTFDQWWKDAGAEQFRAVGVDPTKQVYEDEFQSYREKYLSINPSLIIEDRLDEIKKEYQEWWDNGGGREEFMTKYGHFPDEREYQKFLWIHTNTYTQQYLRYNKAFIPKLSNYENLFTNWILSPSIPSFFIFAVFFFFAFIKLQYRWKFPLFLGLTAATIVIGGLLVDFMTSTSFFNRYEAERYMGMSLPVAFLLGAAAFGEKRLEIPQWVTGTCIAGLMLDMIVNWTVNPGIFGAVTVLSPVMFGLGALAGFKIETRRKTLAEMRAEALEERLKKNASANPMAERKAKTRESIERGFRAAKESQLEKGQQILAMAFNALLQEHPVDTACVKNLTERLTNPSLYIDFSSTQWLEWGEIARSKNAMEAAVLLLKKGLSKEKDPHFARRALFTLGEICVNNKIEFEDGIKRLKKVIEMNENDMMAKQAKRMLEHHG